MNGVVVNEDRQTRTMLFHVEKLSTSLKKLIRKNLSEICHGEGAQETEAKVYSYRQTLKEFLVRLGNRDLRKKKGMIGELLAHVLIRHYKTEFQQVTPFFNLEERSFKKGFDIVLLETTPKKIWLTETKSGGATRSRTADQKTRNLLSAAKRDILKRLETSDGVWLNAITGARVAMSEGKLKKAVLSILDRANDEIESDPANRTAKNVILISVVFSKANQISIDTALSFRDRVSGAGKFSDLIVFSMQKGTYTKVVNFLRREANVE